MFIWNTQSAPDSPEQEQCVTFGSDPRAITAFTVFFLVTVYFIPLIIMVFTYSRILHTIVKQSDFRQGKDTRLNLFSAINLHKHVHTDTLSTRVKEDWNYL